jgi:RNA 2',3'-cyclic 3'-phosphodiesterase
MRTFIALELSEPVRQALAEIQKKLHGPIRGARWTRPEGTHLTLKFLGESNPDQVKAICLALDEISTGFGSFSLTLAGVGAFPRASNPNVIWIGLEENAELVTLQKMVEERIAPLGFPSEKRPFRGHLTLARLSGEYWPQELRDRFLEMGSVCSGVTWVVDSVVLFRSDLKPSGAIYTKIHSSILKTGKN